jgi:hypothetical protein
MSRRRLLELHPCQVPVLRHRASCHFIPVKSCSQTSGLPSLHHCQVSVLKHPASCHFIPVRSLFSDIQPSVTSSLSGPCSQRSSLPYRTEGRIIISRILIAAFHRYGALEVASGMARRRERDVSAHVHKNSHRSICSRGCEERVLLFLLENCM